MIKDFKNIALREREVSKLQDNLREFFVPFTKCQIIDGNLLTNISLTTGQENVIEHKLGRELLGWMIVRKRATSDIWDAQDSNVLKTKNLVLNCSSNVTVDLWVF